MLRGQPTYEENPQLSPINYDWGYDDRSIAKAWTVRGLNTKRTSDHIRFLYEDAKVPEGIFLGTCALRGQRRAAEPPARPACD